MKKLLTITAITLSVASSSAFAHNHNNEWNDSGKMKHHFTRMDANNDGYVSRAEHQAASNNMFNEADTNHNNILTTDEFWDYKNRYYSKQSHETRPYYNGTKSNYDSNIVDHNMDPRYYNNKRANKVNDTEYDNKSY